MVVPSLTSVLAFFVYLLTYRTTSGKIQYNRQLAITQSTVYMNTNVCKTIPGLTKAQKELCYREPDTVLVALQGLNEAVKECQHQFKGHRWNCSSLATKGRNPYISAIFQKGFRETAFASAIVSAAVVLSVAKSCSAGTLPNCGCDAKIYKNGKQRITAKPPPAYVTANDWKWGGCSHNLKYGIRFSKLFLDSRELAEDIHSIINLHNNQVGRKIVSGNMHMKCKCHGMSGGCELKTCFRSTPDLRQVGTSLKEKYGHAFLMDQNNLSNKSLRKFNSINMKKRKKKMRLKVGRKNKNKRDLTYELMYYQKSPNFCERDSALDVDGTTGRYCNQSSIGPESCSSLCCGRGYNLVMKRYKDHCNCKFKWCCNVVCERCSVEEWISVCK